MKKLFATVLAMGLSLSLSDSAVASTMKEAWGEVGYMKSDYVKFRILKSGVDFPIEQDLKVGVFVEHINGDTAPPSKFATALSQKVILSADATLLGGAITHETESEYFRLETALGKGEASGIDVDLWGVRGEAGKNFTVAQGLDITPFVGVIHASISVPVRGIAITISDTGLFGGVKLEKVIDNGSLYLKITGANNTYGFDDNFTHSVTGGIKFQF